MSNFDVGNPYGLREFQLTGNTLTCREYVAIVIIEATQTLGAQPSSTVN
jgi:hypothetical protein